MTTPITEITDLDPNRLDAVGDGANGFPVLLMKSLDGSHPQYRESVELAHQDDYEEDDPEEMEKAFCGDDTCVVCAGRLAKGKLSSKERNALPDSAFVFPKKRAYPIHDKSHARNALSRVAQNGSPKEKARVKAAVHAKFPGIGGKKKAMKGTPTQDSGEAQALAGLEAQEGARRQTRGNHRDMGPKRIPGGNKRRGNDIDPESMNHLADTLPQGGGDTAPDKDLRMDEALGQTHQVARKSDYPSEEARDVDMEGDKAGESDDARERRESLSQTHEVAKKGKRAKRMEARNKAAKSDGDYAEGEEHDVALGEAAGKLLEHAASLVSELTQHEKTEESAYKSLALTTQQSEQATAQARALLRGLTDNLRRNTEAAKELEDMTAAELNDLLSQREERLIKSLQKKLNKKGKAAKAKAKKGKAKKGVITRPEPLVDVDAISQRAAEAAGQAVKAAVEPLKDTVDRMAKEKATPRPRPALNDKADPQAVLRDQAAKAADGETETVAGETVMTDPLAIKSLEEKFAKAVDPYEREKLGRELTTARFVIAERQRHGGA